MLNSKKFTWLAAVSLTFSALALAPAHGATLSLNIAAGDSDDGSAPDQSNILPGETFGLIPSSNWNNLYNSALTDWSISGLYNDAGGTTGVSVTSLSGWDTKGYKGGNSGIDDTPFRFGVYSQGSPSADGSVVSITFSGLDSIGSEGYYLIVYIGGDPSTANQKVTLSDGTTTYFFRNPTDFTPELIPITDTAAPSGNYTIGNYAVFGSEGAPLKASTLTISLQAVTGDTRTAGFGGFQIVGFGESEVFWNGLRVDASGWVDTTPFMGWLNIAEDPWIFSTSLGGYIYFPAGQGIESGAWVYAPKF